MARLEVYDIFENFYIFSNLLECLIRISKIDHFIYVLAWTHAEMIGFSQTAIYYPQREFEEGMADDLGESVHFN
jgi:hypothetical protein